MLPLEEKEEIEESGPGLKEANFLGKREKLSQLTRSLSAIPVESLTLSSDFPAKSRSFLHCDRPFGVRSATICHGIHLTFFILNLTSTTHIGKEGLLGLPLAIF